MAITQNDKTDLYQSLGKFSSIYQVAMHKNLLVHIRRWGDMGRAQQKGMWVYADIEGLDKPIKPRSDQGIAVRLQIIWIL